MILQAHIALILVQLFFGAMPVLGKLAIQAGVTPPQLLGCRVLGGTLVLWAVRSWLKLEGIRPADRPRLVLYSVLGVVLNQLLFLEGLSRTTAVNTAVLGTSIPVMTAALAVLMGREPMTLQKGLGIGLSMLGALTLLGSHAFSFSDQYLVGNLLILANSFSYSLYLVLSKPVLEHYPPLTVVGSIFAWGLLLTSPLTLPALSALPAQGLSLHSWGIVAAIVAFPTVGAYVLNSFALKRLRPSVVAVYIYLQPFVTAVAAPLLLGEKLTSRTLGAAALIFTGVFLAGRGRQAPAQPVSRVGT